MADLRPIPQILGPEQTTVPNHAAAPDPGAPGLSPEQETDPRGRMTATNPSLPAQRLPELTPIGPVPRGIFTPNAPMPAAIQSEAAQGERFGKYRLVGALNAGGMAEVFIALQAGMEGFSKVVALKRILPQIAESPEFIQMFLDEARLAAHLDHPNIIRIYDLGSISDRYFISMEYLPGEDLSQIIRLSRRSQRLISPEVAGALIQAAADGLHYAHDLTDEDGQEMGVVHRDVNPSNIFLTYHGQVKVLDFGIAKASVNAGGTQQGTLKGKLGYVAPEQVRGYPADRRSDIFGLGIVLWELLGSRRLFHRQTEAATLMAVVKEEAPRLAEIRKDVDPMLEEIAIRALAKDPEQRFQTAHEVYDALDHWFANRTRPSPAQLAAFLTSLFGEPRAQAKLAIARGSNLRTNIEIVMKQAPEPAPSSVPSEPGPRLPPPLPPRPDHRAGPGPPPSDRTSRLPAPPAGRAAPTWEDTSERSDVAAMEPASRSRPSPEPEEDWPSESEVDITDVPEEPSPPPPWKNRRVQLGAGIAAAAVALVAGIAAVVSGPSTPAGLALGAGDSSLTLESDPVGAFIFLEGEPTGRVTPATLEGLPEGKGLKIRLEKAGFAPVVEIVSLQASGTVVKRFVLEPMSGRLVFKNVPPGAKVMVDGRPVKRSVNLPVGDHLVQLVVDGRFQFSRNVTIESGEQSFTFPDR